MTDTELTLSAHRDGFAWVRCEHEGKAGFYVTWEDERNTAQDMVFVDSAELPNLDWADVRKAAVAGRDVTHMTRIVGYYSHTHNWNPSKIGELKDRRKGQYKIESSQNESSH